MTFHFFSRSLDRLRTRAQQEKKYPKRVAPIKKYWKKKNEERSEKNLIFFTFGSFHFLIAFALLNKMVVAVIVATNIIFLCYDDPRDTHTYILFILALWTEAMMIIKGSLLNTISSPCTQKLGRMSERTFLGSSTGPRCCCRCFLRIVCTLVLVVAFAFDRSLLTAKHNLTEM